MPSAVVYPGGDASQLVRDIPTRTGISNIRSLLLFFDDLVILAEHQPPAIIQIGSRVRRIHEGRDIDFLAEQGVVFASLATSARPLWEATKLAQESFSQGDVFVDESQSEIDHLSHPRDVLVSSIALERYPEKSAVLTIDFLDGISIPPPEIPLADVLLYSRERNLERRRFWDHVNTLARDIDWIKAEKPQEAIAQTVLSQLEEFELSARSSWGRRVVDSMSLQFTLDGPALTAIVGGVAAAGLQLLPVTGSIVVGALGMIRFSVELLPSKPPLPQGVKPLSYLSNVRRL